jgi:methionyl-tRNA synthetase
LRWLEKDRWKMDQASSMPMWMTILILLSIAWTLPWKGVALWKSARNRHLVWFIVLLIVNTLGILEIIYIFGFSKIKTQVA